MAENDEKVQELLELRARRLMERNEPELATVIDSIKTTSDPSEIERLVRGWTGRRDTGRLAFWLTLSYQKVGKDQQAIA